MDYEQTRMPIIVLITVSLTLFWRGSLLHCHSRELRQRRGVEDICYIKKDLKSAQDESQISCMKLHCINRSLELVICHLFAMSLFVFELVNCSIVISLAVFEWVIFWLCLLVIGVMGATLV